MQAFKLTIKQKVALAYLRNRIHFLYRVNRKKAADEALDLFTKPYYRYNKPDPALWVKSNVLQMQTGSGKVFGYEWKSGKPEAKKLLVIHGFSGNSRSFAWYIGEALSKGYDVYAFDAPAHGSSEGNRLNVSIYSQVIGEIINHYGPFDAFISHSLGGLSLMLYLHNHPGQYYPKIVLIAPATESTTAVDKFFDMLQLKPEFRQVFDENIIEKTGMPASWFSISRIISEVNGDILWIHDKDDLTTPIEDVMPVFELGPAHVRFHFTRGLGHSGIYRDEKVKKLIKEFL